MPYWNNLYEKSFSAEGPFGPTLSRYRYICLDMPLYHLEQTQIPEFSSGSSTLGADMTASF